MHAARFARSRYGIVVCTVIGIIVTVFTSAEPVQKQRGLVWGTIRDALHFYRGSQGDERAPMRATAIAANSGAEPNYVGAGKLPVATISRDLATGLQATAGDLLYVSDGRAWTGGLYSAQVIVSGVSDLPREQIVLDNLTFTQVASGRRAEKAVVVERLY